MPATIRPIVPAAVGDDDECAAVTTIHILLTVYDLQ
jgi:hypothetical protein